MRVQGTERKSLLFENGRSDSVTLGPGRARPGKVLGHLQSFGLLQDLPGQEVAQLSLLLVRDQVAKEAIPDALWKQ